MRVGRLDDLVAHAVLGRRAGRRKSNLVSHAEQDTATDRSLQQVTNLVYSHTKSSLPRFPRPCHAAFSRPYRLLLALMAGALSGCAVGPDYQAPRHRPARPLPGQWTAVARHQAEASGDMRTWWTSFNDPMLTRYVEQALPRTWNSRRPARAWPRLASACAGPTTALLPTGTATRPGRRRASRWTRPGAALERDARIRPRRRLLRGGPSGELGVGRVRRACGAIAKPRAPTTRPPRPARRRCGWPWPRKRPIPT